MKCHLCNLELLETSGRTWDVGGRYLASVFCNNKECVDHFGLTVHYQIIHPDENIVCYDFVIQDNDKWYRVWSESTRYNQISNTVLISLYPGRQVGNSWISSTILNIDKHYPLAPTDILKEKSYEIFLKLKGLIIFS